MLLPARLAGNSPVWKNGEMRDYRSRNRPGQQTTFSQARVELHLVVAGAAGW
jgi:hypothetical protein